MSNNRIPTTHAGSLPRPASLRALQKELSPEAMSSDGNYHAAVGNAVRDIVGKQIECGISIVNDGEMSKIGGFAGYVRTRLNGYDGGDTEPRPLPGVTKQFPDYGDYSNWRRVVGHGPISWKNFATVERDIANIKAAKAHHDKVDAFLPASSPGTILNHNSNTYYATRSAYLHAVADAMKREYDAIAEAGLILQIDCPDLAASWDTFYSDIPVRDFRTMMQENIEVLNHATRDIPSERMRIHTCWGARGGPHTGDIEMREIVDLLLTARPAGLSFVAANGRHEWEWRIWNEIKLPEGKIIIPGVVDSTAAIVEHPETIAERIVRFAKAVGRERVIAGSDCGFGYGLPETVVWAKLQSLARGAEIASRALWS